MSESTVFMGVTGTLLAGREITELFATLGLCVGTHYFIQQSNTCYDIQEIYQVLRHGLTGWAFPDLDWIVQGNRKTIIFAGTINLAFRLRMYFHHIAPQKKIRFYNLLCFASHNKKTRQLFVEDPSVQAIITTDALLVRIDFPNVEDVIILKCDHPNQDKQRCGRANHPGGNVQNAWGITYVTKGIMDRARRMVADASSGKFVTVDQGLHIGMAQVLVASCHRREGDLIYANPSSDPPCTCEMCRMILPPPDSCNCSGCLPEIPLPLLTHSRTRQSQIPAHLQLTEEMEEVGHKAFEKFRWEVWYANCAMAGHFPCFAFLPDATITTLLNNFGHLDSLESLKPYIDNLAFLKGQENELLALIMALNDQFDKLPAPVPKQ